MSIDVELVYFSGCPNVDHARSSLRAALAELDREPLWAEWNLDDEETPERVRGYASPAILIGGKHMFGDAPMPANAQACSAMGAPPASAIVEAIGAQR